MNITVKSDGASVCRVFPHPPEQCLYLDWAVGGEGHFALNFMHLWIIDVCVYFKLKTQLLHVTNIEIKSRIHEMAS